MINTACSEDNGQIKYSHDFLVCTVCQLFVRFDGNILIHTTIQTSTSVFAQVQHHLTEPEEKDAEENFGQCMRQQTLLALLRLLKVGTGLAVSRAD